MADILWGKYQEDHILSRHGVSADEFDEAWHDPSRVDLEERQDEKYGPYHLSIGATEAGRVIEMVWRWQSQERALGLVWPITAYPVE